LCAPLKTELKNIDEFPIHRFQVPLIGTTKLKEHLEIGDEAFEQAKQKTLLAWTPFAFTNRLGHESLHILAIEQLHKLHDWELAPVKDSHLLALLTQNASGIFCHVAKH
jgi:hypothetical protein